MCQPVKCPCSKARANYPQAEHGTPKGLDVTAPGTTVSTGSQAQATPEQDELEIGSGDENKADDSVPEAPKGGYCFLYVDLLRWEPEQKIMQRQHMGRQHESERDVYPFRVEY